jgi:hypothetical protein
MNKEKNSKQSLIKCKVSLEHTFWKEVRIHSWKNSIAHNIILIWIELVKKVNNYHSCIIL